MAPRFARSSVSQVPVVVEKAFSPQGYFIRYVAPTPETSSSDVDLQPIWPPPARQDRKSEISLDATEIWKPLSVIIREVWFVRPRGTQVQQNWSKPLRIRAEKHYRNPTSSTTQNIEELIPPVSTLPLTEPPVATSTVSETPNPLTTDPNIILASFKLARENGALPEIPSTEDPSGEPLFGSYKNALVQFNSEVLSTCDPPPLTATDTLNNTAMIVASTIKPIPSSTSLPHSGSGSSSSLGAVPTALLLHSKKEAPLPPPPARQINKPPRPVRTGPSYFNPTIPSADMFWPKASRCLFKSELVHPALSINPKAASVSPPNLSPISAKAPPMGSSNVSSEIAEIILAPATVDKKGKGKIKRPSGASSSKVDESPKPKRGRPPSGAGKHA